jgi:hypothetical protein
VNLAIRGVSVFVYAWLAAGVARADLVQYSFSGIEATTGISVRGSFTYRTDAAGTNQGPNDVFFADVGGSVSITAGGHTYWSSAVSATLLTSSLELSARNPNGDGAGVVLASPDFGTVFPSVASLPARLNPAELLGSSFTIDVYPPLPVPGNVAPGGGAVIAFGQITDLEAVSSAAEPSGLTLACLAVVASVWGRRKQTALT